MLEIIIWDVQHGSSAYIKTPNEKHIVIDLGTGNYKDNNKEFSPLLHLKEKYGVTQLDEVIITHPHTDHIDDIINFDTLSPKTLMRPKHLTEEDIRKANPNSDSEKVDKYLEINSRYSLPITNTENPILPENNGGVSIRSFTPTECGRSNINNHSVVTIIEYARSKVIIPGDNEPVSWKELLEKESFKNAIKNTDILIAPHHGRESGYCAELFEHIEPYLVIISDGPSVETSATEKYTQKAKGWTVYKRSDDSSQTRYCVTTRKDGTIIIKLGIDVNDNPFIDVTVD